MYCFWFLIGLIYQMSYSLDYLLFQMCSHFDFTPKRTNISNQRHRRLSQHLGAFDTVSSTSAYRSGGLANGPFSLPWSAIRLCCLPVQHVRRLIKHWPWWGWARDARDRVSSTPCWCVFLPLVFLHCLERFISLTSPPEMVSNTALHFFSQD